MAFDLRMEESWNEELRSNLQNMLGSSEHVAVAFFGEKSTSSWGIGGRRTDLTSKQRILALTVKTSSLREKKTVRLQVASDSAAGLKIEKAHNLSHLTKIEGVLDDKSGRTFILTFDLLKKQAVRPSPQWTMRSVDDRNLLLISIFKFCKNYHGRPPKLVGIDVVELQLWAQKYSKGTPTEAPSRAETKARISYIVQEEERVDDEDDEAEAEAMESTRVPDDYEIVSKDEEEDMDALLGMYVLGIDEADAFSERLEKELTALDTANVHAILENGPLVDEVTEQLDITMGSIEDMEEWLGAINVKLRYMREDIASIESGNNALEIQARNSTSLLNELHHISDRFRVPPEYVATFRAGTFEEAKVAENVEACQWLASALHDLEPPFLEAGYYSMRAIREKRSELENLKGVFLKRATSFLGDYFSTVVESMLNDKASFSQKGQLRKPDHADLRFKCRTYARMIQHMKALDRNSLQPLRKTFCLSLNLLLRREAREFAKELQSSTVVKQTVSATLDRLDSGKSLQSPIASPSGNSTVSEAYASMLRTFIPYLVDESSFFASFMCFEVRPLTPQVEPDADADNVEEETGAVNDDITPATPNQHGIESQALKEALQELLNGIQEDFYSVTDWAHRLDPWSCMQMQGVTEKYLSRNKADAAWFVHRLLDDLQVRISSHFNQVVVETSKQFERADRNQAGVLFSIVKFANLTTMIESQIVGQNSRDNIDAAYEKMAGTIFAVIENVARNDSKNAEIFALDNYAAFQDRTYELAAVTPSLEKFYNGAADAYAQACQQFAQAMMNYQFERLFLFVQKVENLLLSVEPEKVSSYPGYTKTDLRKTLRASLSGVEKSLQTTYKRMQKSIQRPDVLSTIWNQHFKAIFLDKYKALEDILVKCYKDETLNHSAADMKTILDKMYSS